MLKQMLQAQVDMQIEDVRALLRLPLQEAGVAGCNFSTAAIILNIIAGASVCLYEASTSSLAERGNRGDRFRSLVMTYYPSGEVLAPAELASVLYDAARNPLAHSLGFSYREDQAGTRVAILKDPLTPDQVAELESSDSRPRWLPPTVSRSDLSDGTVEYRLSVPTLYWGLHRMLHSLLSDPLQVSKADAMAESLRSSWTREVRDSAHATDSISVNRLP
jgi:hypothetical protein